jgi:segregation and condensation protein A
MAATLIHIKSRMLLPVETEGDEDEDGGDDPRAELVRRLLEYKQFKEAAAELVERGQQWRDVFGRPAFFERGQISNLSPKEDVDDTPLDMTLFDLVDAFQDIVQRTPVKAFVEVTSDHLTVKDRMNYILERLEYEAAIPFESLFVPEEGRLVIIVTFLGLLELIRIKLIRAYQGEAFGAILLSRAFLPATAEDGESEETQP